MSMEQVYKLSKAKPGSFGQVVGAWEDTIMESANNQMPALVKVDVNVNGLFMIHTNYANVPAAVAARANLMKTLSLTLANVNGRRTYGIDDAAALLSFSACWYALDKAAKAYLTYFQSLKYGSKAQEESGVLNFINEIESSIKILDRYGDVLPVLPSMQRILDLFGYTWHDELELATLIVPKVLAATTSSQPDDYVSFDAYVDLNSAQVGSIWSSIVATFVTALNEQLTPARMQLAADLRTVWSQTRPPHISGTCKDYNLAKNMITNSMWMTEPEEAGQSGGPVSTNGEWVASVSGGLPSLAAWSAANSAAAVNKVKAGYISLVSNEAQGVKFEEMAGVPYASSAAASGIIPLGKHLYRSLVFGSVIAVGAMSSWSTNDSDEFLGMPIPNWTGEASGPLDDAGQGIGLLVGLRLAEVVEMHATGSSDAASESFQFWAPSRDRKHYPVLMEDVFADAANDFVQWYFDFGSMKAKSQSNTRQPRVRNVPYTNKQSSDQLDKEAK